jgi:hypothetical protein
LVAEVGCFVRPCGVEKASDEERDRGDGRCCTAAGRSLLKGGALLPRISFVLLGVGASRSRRSWEERIRSWVEMKGISIELSVGCFTVVVRGGGGGGAIGRPV